MSETYSMMSDYTFVDGGFGCAVVEARRRARLSCCGSCPLYVSVFILGLSLQPTLRFFRVCYRSNFLLRIRRRRRRCLSRSWAEECLMSALFYLCGIGVRSFRVPT
jgi:hypothetical protein